jgi:ornithine lipid ester-linked acyl 2-hydroxylase
MQSFYNADSWRYTQILKDSLPDLQREFDRFPRWLWLNNREHSINSVGKWQFVPFMSRGRKYWPYLWAFPTVRRLLKQIPIYDNCVFSIMGAGAIIPEHQGHPGDHLRVHLGIQTDGAAWIKVGDHTRHWHTGQVTIFDDRLTHQTANPGSERVVFLFDILSKDYHD